MTYVGHSTAEGFEFGGGGGALGVLERFQNLTLTSVLYKPDAIYS